MNALKSTQKQTSKQLHKKTVKKRTAWEATKASAMPYENVAGKTVYLLFLRSFPAENASIAQKKA